MITAISATNFRAFDYIDMELKPITLLLGPNNSGKSAALSILRLLAQTIESRDFEVPLLLNGAFGDFGTYKDMVFGNHRGRPMRLSMTIDSEHVLGRADDIDDITVDFELKYIAERRELVLRHSYLLLDGKTEVATSYSRDTGRQTLDVLGGKEVPASIKATLGSLQRPYNFLPYATSFLPLGSRGTSAAKFLDAVGTARARRAGRLTKAIADQLRMMDFLSAMRLPPARTYLFSGERRRRIGANGENMASLLAIEAGPARRRKSGESIRARASEWLASANIAAELEVHALTDRHYELRIRHPDTGEIENLADVGYGHSQVLPVLVGGYALPPRSTYLIEEPEIHLHPSAQAELGDFFLELRNGGIQCLVETHSEYLILRIQQHVANGHLDADDVAIYYANPTPDGKTVVRIDLDELGRFTEDWPRGFFPERLEEAKELARIRMIARGD